MRLLNASTQELKTFYGEVPEYAILSHTWGEDEITLQDLQKINGNIPITDNEANRLHNSGGLTKITECCKQAIKDKLKWVWVDTCCIDKTNSVELSEAINSMFQWYQGSQVCYAFLTDVPNDDPVESEDSKFRASRWFTRGWTLQELLAPSRVIFYGKGWTKLGDRQSLVEVISATAKIPTRCLSDNRYREEACIAQKMSWASKRKTTRTEDIACCLLGLFGVNMPLLYGEGTKAFLRLQEELVRTKPDNSVLIWETTLDLWWSSPDVIGFAPSPAVFSQCGDVVCYGYSTLSLVRLGLQLETFRYRRRQAEYVVLDCGLAHKPNHRFHLLVRKRPEFGLNNVLFRSGWDSPITVRRESYWFARKRKVIIATGLNNATRPHSHGITINSRFSESEPRLKISVALNTMAWNPRFIHCSIGWYASTSSNVPITVLPLPPGVKTGSSYILFESDGGLNHPPLCFIIRASRKPTPLFSFPFVPTFSLDFAVPPNAEAIQGDFSINLDTLIWTSRAVLADNVFVSFKRRIVFPSALRNEEIQLQTIHGS